MTMVDRIKLLFNRKGDHEKKVAFLSERRAALSHQRDTAGDELFKLEKRESQLRHDFKDNDSVSARRRVTSELVQLKKEIDRRQQLQQVVTQQINIVGTHLHNLELLKQGRSANLPSTDEIATDAAAAEEMLAQLQADSELVDAVGSSSIAGMSGEEQALYDQLIAEETSAVPEKTIVSQTPEAVKVEPAKSPASLGTPTREPG